MHGIEVSDGVGEKVRAGAIRERRGSFVGWDGAVLHEAIFEDVQLNGD
jgi:hypothetical protein